MCVKYMSCRVRIREGADFKARLLIGSSVRAIHGFLPNG